MKPAILAYWDIRGLAQPIRLLLEYTQMPWEDKLYVCGPAPTFEKTCWFGEKETLDLDFPNLPYFIDGDVRLSQSDAILHYIARKHDLAGKTEEERIRIDLVYAELCDMRGSFVSTCYSKDFESLKPTFLQNVAVRLNRLSKFLGERPYFAGENLTYVDFVAYEYLDQLKMLEPTILSNFKNLDEFTKGIEKLELIDKYMKSDRFIRSRLNNRMASFGA